MQESSSAYAPTVVTVTTASSTILAADDSLRTLEMTSTGTTDVWYCAAPQTAVVGRGFYLPAGKTKCHDHTSIFLNGINAIASGSSCTVALGRG